MAKDNRKDIRRLISEFAFLLRIDLSISTYCQGFATRPSLNLTFVKSSS